MNLIKLISVGLISLFLFSSISAKDKISDDTIREWVQQLGDESYKVREKAIKALSNLPDNNRKLLIEELKNIKNLEVQDRLKNILKLSEDRVIELLSDLYLKGKKLHENKKYEEAITEINKIIDIEPDNEMAMELKAKILQEKEEFKECIVILKKLLASDKKNIKEKEELYNTLNLVLISAGEYTEAISQLEKASLISPEKNQNLLCTTYELNNFINKAEDIYIKNNKEMPMNPHTFSALAWFYIRTGKLEKVKPLLESFFTLNKEFDVDAALNYIFLEQYQNGLDKIKSKTETFLKEINDKKKITKDDLKPNDVYFLNYQYYFELSLSNKTSIDFKKIYTSFSDEDKKNWPNPLIGLYSGELSFEKLEAQLQSPNKQELRMNNCEAYFYYGLLKLTEKNINEAKKYFQLSKEQKVYEYVEDTAASYMLEKFK